MYSPVNSYFIYNGYWTLNIYILLYIKNTLNGTMKHIIANYNKCSGILVSCDVYEAEIITIADDLLLWIIVLYIWVSKIYTLCLLVETSYICWGGGLSSACQFQSNPRKLTRGKLLMKHTYTIHLT